jgi:hypothetical protein
MTTPGKNTAPVTAPLGEVRYSLGELLREVRAERNAPAFAMEKLDQVEIAKLYRSSRRRRVLRNKK